MQGCVFENPLGFLNDYENKVQKAKSANIQYISVVTRPNYNEFGVECMDGEQDILNLAVVLGNKLDMIMDNIKELKMSLNCGVLEPVWNDGIEEAMCKEGVNAIIWTFYSFLLVSFCGLALYTLRAARNDVEVAFTEKEEEFEDSWKNGRRGTTPRSMNGKVTPYEYEDELILKDEADFEYGGDSAYSERY